MSRRLSNGGIEVLGELTFIGMGLHSHDGISLKGLSQAKEADTVFAEFYTSLMPGLNHEELRQLVGKSIHVVTRKDLEEEEGKEILYASRKGKAVLLVPGDPLIATTHVDLRIRAEKQGIRTSIIHGASIISAAIGLSGLQNYKFGRSVTIPFMSSGIVSETPYDVIEENKNRGLHTLCFLDIKTDEEQYMTANQGLETLFKLENRRRQSIIASDTIAVGIARAGSENSLIKADFAPQLIRFDFGQPPHSLILPGRLHFMEAEALVTLAKAPESVKEMIT